MGWFTKPPSVFLFVFENCHAKMLNESNNAIQVLELPDQRVKGPSTDPSRPLQDESAGGT